MVNVALRTIGEDLDASLAQLQWINNGYLVSLAALILLGGSLGDRLGRRRMFIVGTIWFALASVLCGLAPNAETLIVARILQGVGGAMLTPGSPAMIRGAFVPDDRGKAIGARVRPGRRGGRDRAVRRRRARRPRFVALDLPDQPAARGRDRPHRPAVGAGDPRPPCVRTLRRAGRRARVPGPRWHHLRPDRVGRGRRSRAGAAGLIAAVAFVMLEHREEVPMMPLGLYRDRTFSASNAMTFLVYAALGAMSFFPVIQLQTVAGYNALQAGLGDAADHALHALPRGEGGRARQPHRPADPDDRRAAGDGARPPLRPRCRRGRELLDRRLPRRHRLRPRPGPDGRAADGHRAGGRP
ncbi:MFS transporter [Nocardioides sp. B-3]|uniref:MFS transporter n=1 Tax=Nocardioides sp. B-3 TaxID=2895565 RepID=UPI0021533DDC|nr:MFS transporter [Nocardioides sp. B-3]UUZ61054.1 MFS transporter [Nocardioides sp. B-3]